MARLESSAETPPSAARSLHRHFPTALRRGTHSPPQVHCQQHCCGPQGPAGASAVKTRRAACATLIGPAPARAGRFGRTRAARGRTASTPCSVLYVRRRSEHPTDVGRRGGPLLRLQGVRRVRAAIRQAPGNTLSWAATRALSALRPQRWTGAMLLPASIDSLGGTPPHVLPAPWPSSRGLPRTC